MVHPIAQANDDRRLTPLTSNNGDESCPKALLPVANKAILDYVLAWVEQARIQGAYIFARASISSSASLISLRCPRYLPHRAPHCHLPPH